MTGELSWEDLVLELEKASAPGPLQATWLAYEGNEDYGIWLLQPFGPELEERRSSFSQFAAHRRFAGWGFGQLQFRNQGSFVRTGK